MINSTELTDTITARGFQVEIDHDTAFMVIARIQKRGKVFLARVTAQRTAVFHGAERMCQTGGKTWQAALTQALDLIDAKLIEYEVTARL